MGGGKPLINFKGAPQSPGTRYRVKANVNSPNPSLPTEICCIWESWGNGIFPNRYRANIPKMAIHMARNSSLSNQCNCNTRSALERNLKARASSKKPKKTFTEFSHPPDFGREFNHPGKSAKNIKGSASAKEKPSMPIMGAIPPLPAASTNKVPTMGPVQEKETMARARAMNNIPMTPPLTACLSTLFAHEYGST